MRALLIILASFLLSVAPFTTHAQQQQNEEEPTREQVAQMEAELLALCTGITDISNAGVRTMAIAHCSGKVRGFIDGHVMTVALLRSGNPVFQTLSPLWCVSPRVPAIELYHNTLAWMVAENEAYEQLKGKTSGKEQTFAFVMLASLRMGYPCGQSTQF